MRSESRSEARPGILPAHVAVYWHGVAQHTPSGVAMRSAFGPYVEEIAESVRELTVVAYDPSKGDTEAERLADYVARPSRGNINVLSLGDFGSRRDYLQRRRRVADIVGEASREWDLLLLRYGRRANLVLRANRCPRIVTLVWGTSLFGGLWTSLLRARTPVKIASILRSEWHLRRTLSASGLAFTDGEACRDQYQHLVGGGNMGLLRSSSRRARYSFVTDDRMGGDEVNFVVVGHVTVEKGALDAIESFGEIRNRLLSGARLHVVGVGAALEKARALVKRLGLEQVVTFHGWVAAGDDLYRLYRDADVLLFLSRSSSESLPRVVSEAWANSVLVVGTPVGSLPAAFEDGRELLFVPFGDIDAVVDAVRRLRDDEGLRHAILDRGRERAQEATVEYVTGAMLDAVQTRWPELAGPRTLGVAR